MALTQDQIDHIRRQVGNQPDDAALNVLFDRLLTVDELVLQILETRLAELERIPAQFAVSGEYSQSTAANITALRDRIASLGGGAEGGGGVGFVTFTEPYPMRHR